MKIVIQGISDLGNLYWNEVDIIFYDNSKWWIKNNIDEERKPISIYDYKLDWNFLNTLNIENIIPEIVECLPIISRWMGRGDQYQLLLREAYLEILYIISGLKILDIKNAIFQTGVVHHLSTLIFEKGCSFYGIKSIYTYPDLITSRFILFQQKVNIKDRKALNYSISNFKSNDLVDDFINNKLLNKKPKNNSVVTKKQSTLAYAICYILATFGKNSLNKLRNRIPKKTNYFYQTYPFQNILQIIQQYKALKYYNQNLVNNNTLLSKNNNKKLLIAAHFQPEATTFPEGWEMSNHIDIVIKLRRLGYNDDLLYKEHFASTTFVTNIVGLTRVGMYRSDVYYKQLLDLGCLFIDSSFILPIDNTNYLPVTITGTIAVERSLLGLTTIVMGYPWYKGLPGTIHIDEISSLENINDEWLKTNEKIAEEAKLFLNNLLSYSTLNSLNRTNRGRKISNEELNNFKQEFDCLLINLNKETNN